MKTNEQSNILLEEIANIFNHFLKNGVMINLNTFAKKINPNLNINDIKKLLRIHFVLTETTNMYNIGVVDFIHSLPKRIRRIKTIATINTKILHGKIRGRVNIKKTLQQRFIHYPAGKRLFACDENKRTYNIHENLVLKRVLQIIYSIIHVDLKFAFEENYKWLKNWISEKELKRLLNQFYNKNVYLKKIALNKETITDRMIKNASSSRNVLYKEAAFLLMKYRNLMNLEFNEAEIIELFKNTFIIPDKIEVLFELYWIMKLLKYVKMKNKEIKFQLIDNNNQIIAKWENNGYYYKIFHDSIGSFKFKEEIQELNKKYKDEDNFIGRELQVIEKLKKITSTYSTSYWERQPDIILEKYDKNMNLVLIMIGEVKYTNYKDYAIMGLRDLLEYTALIKNKTDGKYLKELHYKQDESIKIISVLFTGKIEDFELQEDEGDEEVKLIMFGEEKKFKNLIKIMEL